MPAVSNMHLTSMRKSLAVAVALSMGVVRLPAGADDAGKDLPLGHPDFTPSRERPVGWRGDGSGNFPGATPPAFWFDGTTVKNIPDGKGKPELAFPFDEKAATTNIRWRVTLPNWSNSSPIVVGRNVFVMCEATEAFPLLVCFDADTGRELWRREVDTLRNEPAEIQERVRKSWIKYLGLVRDILPLCAERVGLENELLEQKKAEEVAQTKSEQEDQFSGRSDGGKSDLDIEPVAGKKAVKSPAVLAMEARIDAWRKRAATWKLQDGVVRQKYPRFDFSGPIGETDWAEIQSLRRYGCTFQIWDTGIIGFSGGKATMAYGAYTAYSHPTPVSDGKYVWVYTGHNAAACFTVDGQHRWTVRLGEARYPTWYNYLHSPVLAGDTLILSSNEELVALNADTGGVVWRMDARGGGVAERANSRTGPLMTGVRLRLGEEWYYFWDDGRLYRVRDGKSSARIVEKGGLYSGLDPIVVGQDIVCLLHEQPPFASKVLRRVRFAVEGDTITPHTVWDSCERYWGKGDPGAFDPVLRDGKIYVPEQGHGDTKRCRIVNAENGKSTGELELFVCRLGGPVIGKDRIVTVMGVQSSDAAYASVTSVDGKLLGRNMMSCRPRTKERDEWVRRHTGINLWNDGYWNTSWHSSPFLADGRIYLRSREHLYCIEQNQ